MTSTEESKRKTLETLLPGAIVVTDPDLLGSYLRDQSRLTAHGRPLAVLLPRTTAEVAHCLQVTHELALDVVPRGAGSGLSGGANASAGCVVLSLHRMDAILEINPADRLAVVQPGVITSALRAAAEQEGLFYPPDPGSVEMCTMGGNVATNAGGMCCVKYGVTGDFVIGLEVVLVDGRVMRTGRRTVKGVAGYDLTRLFVGSEGTLGVVTEITVRLVPKPSPAHTLVASFESLHAAGEVVAGLTREGLVPSMVEIMDRTTVQAVDAMSRMGMGHEVAALLLIQSDDPDADGLLTRIEDICARLGATDVARSSDPSEAEQLLQARRLALPALEQLGDWLLDDVSVPRSRMVELIGAVEEIGRRHEVVIGVFGHAGDGNLHPTFIFDDTDPRSRAAVLTAFDEVTQKTLELGGTITGEHGVGQLKRDWLERELDPTARDVHAAIKSALDPSGRLNPGTVLARGAGPSGAGRVSDRD